MDIATLEQRIRTLEAENQQLRAQLAATTGEPTANERTRTEQELQRYRDIINNTPIGIAEAPASTGLLSHANPAFCQMSGYTREELATMTLPEVTDEDPDFIMGTLRTVIEQGIWQGEIRYRRKDGSIFPAHLTANMLYLPDGTPNVAIGFVRDLSAEQEQAEQLQLNRFTVENAADAIGWYDLSGKVLYFNRAAYNLYGYTPADLGTLYATDIDPDFDAGAFGRLLERLKQEGSILIERTHRHRDGTAILVEATNSYIRFNDREYISVVIRDIRERKAAEAEREALQQQIISAQREALRELSSPLIPITDDIVVMPLVGTIDSGRAQQVMETLLEGVAHYQADLVILDITGVQVVDTQVAQAFIQAAQAVRLLGAQVMLTGIQPQIAQTLVHLGVDLGMLKTASSLQSGIAAALRDVRAGNQPAAQAIG